jgi:hypothetical protein
MAQGNFGAILDAVDFFYLTELNGHFSYIPVLIHPLSRPKYFYREKK